MKPYIVMIPARFGSTRLRGKPLKSLAGKPILQHVIEIAKKTLAVRIIIVTDYPAIVELASLCGVESCLTADTHVSGTSRIAEAARRLAFSETDIIVNLQGDEPFMPPEYVTTVAQALTSSGADMATLSTVIEDSDQLFNPNIVKVVTTIQGKALYFSRSCIPWSDRDKQGYSFQRHIGIYAYRVEFLQRYASWPLCPLENLERLEQLRALWHGAAIQVQYVEAPVLPGIDTLEELLAAERLLTSMGTIQ